MLNSEIPAASEKIVLDLQAKYPGRAIRKTEHYTTDGRFVVFEFHFSKPPEVGSFAFHSYTSGNNMRSYDDLFHAVEYDFCRFYGIRQHSE